MAGRIPELDDQTTNTNAYGASAQVTDTGDLFGRPNHLVGGVSYDGAQTLFSATAFLGGLTPQTRVFTGPGVVLDEPGNTIPVRVGISTGYEGAYASDTLDVDAGLVHHAVGPVQFGPRWILSDKNGGDLTGQHAYNRFNPAAGATYRFAPWLTAYAGYSEANRAPTPSELSCAGPDKLLRPGEFLRGRSGFEAGDRAYRGGRAARRLQADAGRPGELRSGACSIPTRTTTSLSSIASISTAPIFANVGQNTARRASTRIVAYKTALISMPMSTTPTRRRVSRPGLWESAGSNPAGDADGNITIRPGDRLPGIPANKVTAGTRCERDAGLERGWHRRCCKAGSICLATKPI